MPPGLRNARNSERAFTLHSHMNQAHLPHWLQPIVLWLGSIGGVGLLLIGFLDSSFLPLPIINDLLVVELSMRNHARMPYYALMATVGSVLGCVFLYFIARKGGEIFFRKRAGGQRRKNSALGATEWIRQHSGDGAASAANSVQNICARVRLYSKCRCVLLRSRY